MALLWTVYVNLPPDARPVEHPPAKIPDHELNWLHSLFDSVLVFLLAIFIGTVTGVLASGFMAAYKKIKPWLFEVQHWLPGHWHTLGLVLIPAAGGLLAALIVRHLARGKVVTPAEVILVTHVKDGSLNIRSGLASYLASFVAITTGNSVGQYGPMVQMGATIGHALDKIPALRHPFHHVAMACGVAAAISAAFQAPIAGVVFAHEVLLRFFSIRLFAPVTIAAVSSYLVSRTLFGKQILFELPFEPTLFASEYFFFGVLGIIGGLVAVVLMRSIFQIQKKPQLQSIPLTWRLFLAGAFTGLLALVYPQILGSSNQGLYLTVLGEVPLMILLGVFFAKFLSTTLSLGLGMPGGILSPSMYLGALLGGSLGYAVHALLPYGNNDVALYALVGMGAMASAAIGGPLSIILFMMEITGDYEIVTAVMTGVVLANIASYRLLGTSSLFDLQLMSRGFDLTQGREAIHLQQRNVAEILRQDFPRIEAETPLQDAHRVMVKAQAMEAFAVDADQNYLGHITLMMVDALLDEGIRPDTPCGEYLRQSEQVLFSGHSLHQAIRLVETFSLDHIPVLESENKPKLLGIIYENELVTHWLESVRISKQMQHLA